MTDIVSVEAEKLRLMGLDQEDMIALNRIGNKLKWCGKQVSEMQPGELIDLHCDVYPGATNALLFFFTQMWLYEKQRQ